MILQDIAILDAGLVTSVGLSAAASCAAIRSKITNPSETRFMDTGGEWIMAHSVSLGTQLHGRAKLVKMAALAISEALENINSSAWSEIPLLVCVAERDRAGRDDGLDQEILAEIQLELQCKFSPKSTTIPKGRVGVGFALAQAFQLIDDGHAHFVTIVGVDSLLRGATLAFYESNQRLLTSENSNGFIPGEGAAALVVGRKREYPKLVCTGIGLAREVAHISSGSPLLGLGLAQAIRTSLAAAGCEAGDIDLRITDVSGEHYYFKEAALALTRTMRDRRTHVDVWNPAECIGETGSVSGVALIIIAHAAYNKQVAPGNTVLCQATADSGERMAVILQFQTQ